MTNKFNISKIAPAIGKSIWIVAVAVALLTCLFTTAYAQTGSLESAVKQPETKQTPAVEVADECNIPELGSYKVVQNGALLTGKISSKNYLMGWCFEAQVGEYILIDMSATSGTLDSQLYLFDQKGDYLLHQDDSFPGSKNSLILYQAEKSGVYLFAATRYGIDEGTTTGAFDINFKQLRLDQLDTLLGTWQEPDEMFLIAAAFDAYGMPNVAATIYAATIAVEPEFTDAYYQLGRIAFYEYDDCGTAFTFWSTYAILENVDLFSFLVSEVGFAAVYCIWNHANQ